MAPPLLRAYTVMRPRVEAERLLALSEATAAGSGQMKKADLARWLADQRRTAGLHRSGKQRPRTAAEWKALGMNVTYEKKG